jgi:hypothetical protein
VAPPRDIDEQVVRDRRDPRREESIPPEARKSARPPEEEIPEVTALAPSEAPPPAVEEPPPPSRPSAKIEPESQRRRVTNVDPRLEALEPLLRAADWDGVIKQLGSPDEAGKLPPNLGLLYAIARKEKETSESKGSDATELAIRCTAGLLGTAPESPVALVVAKRIVRKNPVAWQKAPAPRASVSAIIILVAIAIGGLVGWLVATGRLQVHLRW